MNARSRKRKAELCGVVLISALLGCAHMTGASKGYTWARSDSGSGLSLALKLDKTNSMVGEWGDGEVSLRNVSAGTVEVYAPGLGVEVRDGPPGTAPEGVRLAIG